MRTPFALAAVLLLLAACDQSKSPDAPPTTATADTAAPAPPRAGSTGLTKRGEASSLYIDQIGTALNPASQKPAVTEAAGTNMISGFAYDDTVKAPAAGVDVVIDGVPQMATYGLARPDVAEYFKSPNLTAVGFNLTLPAGAIAPGEHKLTIRVIAADGKSYSESAEVPFTVR